jgi:hypothetical protein
MINPFESNKKYPVEREPEIRALASHLGYVGMEAWFASLPLLEPGGDPKIRQVVNAEGWTAAVKRNQQGHYLNRTVGFMFKSPDDPGAAVTIRTRGLVNYRGNTDELAYDSTGTLIRTDMQTFGDIGYPLQWSGRPGEELGLWLVGCKKWGANPNLSLATVVGVENPADAERLLLDAASFVVPSPVNAS